MKQEFPSAFQFILFTKFTACSAWSCLIYSSISSWGPRRPRVSDPNSILKLHSKLLYWKENPMVNQTCIAIERPPSNTFILTHPETPWRDYHYMWLHHPLPSSEGCHMTILYEIVWYLWKANKATHWEVLSLNYWSRIMYVYSSISSKLHGPRLRSLKRINLLLNTHDKNLKHYWPKIFWHLKHKDLWVCWWLFCSKLQPQSGQGHVKNLQQ